VPPFTRLYRYVRFRKGHGVHSPFAFGLINKVIEEKKAFYVFEEIERILAKTIFRKKIKIKYGRLLFRLVNFFKAKSVLQIGISEGWQAMYLNAAAEQLIVLDRSKDKLVEASGLNNPLKPLRAISGEYPLAVKKAIKELPSLDILYLNVSADPVLTKNLFDRCLPYVHSNTVFVLDGIRKKEMKPVWKYISQRSDIPVTMDLCSLGLVFFDRKMYKRNYKLFF